VADRALPTLQSNVCFTQSYSIRERDIIKLGKQKLKVREVVPMDYNPSVIIGNSENIRVSKAVYE
jgi:predicted amino acid racemase